MSTPHHTKQLVGRYAEQFVAQKYSSQGWTILQRNYRHTGFEVDIIAEKQNTLVFIEVKYRNKIPSNIEEILSVKKKTYLTRGALHFAEEYRKDEKQARFDLVFLFSNQQYLFYPNAFTLVAL